MKQVSVLSNLRVAGAVVVDKDTGEFPSPARVGMFAVKSRSLYVYQEINGFETWYPVFQNETPAYLHTQAIPSTEWTVNHNLNTTTLWYGIQDGNGNKIYEASRETVDGNITKLYFTEAVAGTAIFVGPNSVDLSLVNASQINVGNNVTIDSSGVKVGGEYVLTLSSLGGQLAPAVSTAVDSKLASLVGAANGIAGLNASGKLSDAVLPSDVLVTADKGAANGVASLGADGKVPSSQLPPMDIPAGILTTSDLGSANGPAVLDATGKLAISELPVSVVTEDQLGIANGVATLGADGKLTSTQLPVINIPADVLTSGDIGVTVAGLTNGKLSVGELPSNVLTTSDVGASVASLSGGKLLESELPTTVVTTSDIGSKIPGLTAGKIADAVLPTDVLRSADLGTAYGPAALDGNSKLNASEIPGLDWSKIVSGKPNTLAGYNISDAVPISEIGVAGGVASLGADGKVPSSQLPAAVAGGLNFLGTWNAATNTPTIVSGSGTSGAFYKVSVEGTTLIDGTSQWGVGDLVLFDGTTWDRVDGGTTEVTSVAGRVGAVTLSQSDISGTVPVTKGGTGATTAEAALTALGAYPATNPNGYITSASAPVQSVAGRTGAVTLAQADISGLTSTSSPTFAAVTAATFTGALVGNASTASKLATARTFALTGDVSGSGTFDGSGNLSIATTLNVAASAAPYDVSASVFGIPTDGETMARVRACRAFNIPNVQTNGQAGAGVAATATAVFTVYKNGTNIGTITFAAGSKVGVISITSSTNFAVGDVLSIVCPAIADATLSQIDISLVGNTI